MVGGIARSRNGHPGTTPWRWSAPHPHVYPVAAGSPPLSGPLPFKPPAQALSATARLGINLRQEAPVATCEAFSTET